MVILLVGVEYLQSVCCSEVVEAALSVFSTRELSISCVSSGSESSEFKSSDEVSLLYVYTIE